MWRPILDPQCYQLLQRAEPLFANARILPYMESMMQRQDAGYTNSMMRHLCRNTAALHIVEANKCLLDKHCIDSLCENPMAADFICRSFAGLPKRCWQLLCKNTNRRVLDLMEARIDKLDLECWKNLLQNPSALHILNRHASRTLLAFCASDLEQEFFNEANFDDRYETPCANISNNFGPMFLYVALVVVYERAGHRYWSHQLGGILDFLSSNKISRVDFCRKPSMLLTSNEFLILCGCECAVPFLQKNLQKAVATMNPDKIWNALSKNSRAVGLLKEIRGLVSAEWGLSIYKYNKNPAAVDVLHELQLANKKRGGVGIKSKPWEDLLDSIFVWCDIAVNPGAFHFLRKHELLWCEKTFVKKPADGYEDNLTPWNFLCLNPHPSAALLLQGNLHRLTEEGFGYLCENESSAHILFRLDYLSMKKANQAFRQELESFFAAKKETE